MKGVDVKKFLILGSGALAKECCFYIWDTYGESVELVLFSDMDSRSHVEIKGKKISIVNDFTTVDKSSCFICAIGTPQQKYAVVKNALDAGFAPAETVIHPRAFVQCPGKIGKAGIIAPGVVVAADATIGDYVLLNYNCTVGHDSIIEDFVTINPSANISGCNTIGRGTLIGVGAVTKQEITIGPDSICGAQSCCLKDLPAKSKVVGVPAKPME